LFPENVNINLMIEVRQIFLGYDVFVMFLTYNDVHNLIIKDASFI